MKTVSEALAVLQHGFFARREDLLTLDQVGGRVLAQNILSPIAMPVHDYSAMDGFLVRHEDTLDATETRPLILEVMGKIYAGDWSEKKLQPHQCYKIMTGAAINQVGDAVVPIEHVENRGDLEITLKKSLAVGENIRRAGEEFLAGTLLAKMGQVMDATVVGNCAAVGVHQVCVYGAPRIGILTTGSELVEPGFPLKRGQIYNSNGAFLRAALKHWSITPSVTGSLVDDEAAVLQTLDRALAQSDWLLVTGGVSVGDTDFVKSALARLGVQEIFWRVAQKPGKPFYYGRLGDKHIFGLPGNPASVAICYYFYVERVLQYVLGLTEQVANFQKMRLAHDLQTSSQLTLLLKGQVFQENSDEPDFRVRSLQQQGSHMLRSLIDCNAIVCVPPQSKPLPKGDWVQVCPLPEKKGPQFWGPGEV